MRYFLFSFLDAYSENQLNPVFRILAHETYPSVHDVTHLWNDKNGPNNHFIEIKGPLISLTEISEQDAIDSGMLQYNT